MSRQSLRDGGGVKNNPNTEAIGMTSISPVELQKRLHGESDLLLLDVRTPAEYAQVHVPGARNIPLSDLNSEGLGVGREKMICILCHSGGRAAKAAGELTGAGYANALVVEGGTQGWIAAGLPVERSGAKRMSLERQVRIAAGSLILLGVLLGFLFHPAFFLLSGFIGAGLIVAGITDWCGMGLLIARFPWNR
jgi:rhodanese-related sulfurtransferase